MSDYEKCKGTLLEIKSDMSLEKICRELCNINNFKMEKCHHGSWEECLLDYDNGGEDYIVLNNKLYKILNFKSMDIYEDYCDITNLGGGVYTFETQFYNGGACLREMLQENFLKEVQGYE